MTEPTDIDDLVDTVVNAAWLTVSHIAELERRRGVPIAGRSVRAALMRGTLAGKRDHRGEWLVSADNYRAWSSERRPRGRRSGAG